MWESLVHHAYPIWFECSDPFIEIKNCYLNEVSCWRLCYHKRTSQKAFIYVIFSLKILIRFLYFYFVCAYVWWHPCHYIHLESRELAEMNSALPLGAIMDLKSRCEYQQWGNVYVLLTVLSHLGSLIFVF